MMAIANGSTIAGCGKTVISSTIIESLYLQDLKANIAYFYFDFNDVQNVNLPSVEGLGLVVC